MMRHRRFMYSSWITRLQSRLRGIFISVRRRREKRFVSMEGNFFRHITEGLLKSKSQGLVRDEEEIKSNGVRRSLTQSAMPKTIAELQAKLQKSGDNEWRKRIPKLNSANEELSLLNVKNIYNVSVCVRNFLFRFLTFPVWLVREKWGRLAFSFIYGKSYYDSVVTLSELITLVLVSVC